MDKELKWNTLKIYVINKDELFQQQAPSFNFELDADQLLEKALKDGYVRFYKEQFGGETLYLINQDYGKQVNR